MNPNEKLREKIAEMPADALDRSIQTTMKNILAGEESALADAQLLAELVAEQRKRQRVAKARIGEYFRQRAIWREYSRRSSSGGNQDTIDTVRADPYSGRATLRYSDIEVLALAVERDTKTPFLAEQQRRLAAQLAANPKLTAKQKDMLALVALGGCRESAPMNCEPSYIGPSGGRLDRRTVTRLIERKILEINGADYSFYSMIIIAAVPE